MTVKQLKLLLNEYDEDMCIDLEYGFDIEGIEKYTWVHTNYPYDKPDEDRLKFY